MDFFEQDEWSAEEMQSYLQAPDEFLAVDPYKLEILPCDGGFSQEDLFFAAIHYRSMPIMEFEGWGSYPHAVPKEVIPTKFLTDRVIQIETKQGGLLSHDFGLGPNFEFPTTVRTLEEFRSVPKPGSWSTYRSPVPDPTVFGYLNVEPKGTHEYQKSSWGYVDSDLGMEDLLDDLREGITEDSAVVGIPAYVAARTELFPEPALGSGIGRGGAKIMELFPDLGFEDGDFAVDLGCAPGSLSLALTDMPNSRVIGITNTDPVISPNKFIPALSHKSNFAAIVSSVTDPHKSDNASNIITGIGKKDYSVCRTSSQAPAMMDFITSGIKRPPRLVISDCCIDQTKSNTATAREWEWANGRLVLMGFHFAQNIAGPRTTIAIKMLGVRTHLSQSIIHFAAQTFAEVSLVKPTFSRAVNDEIYLVCKNRLISEIDPRAAWADQLNDAVMLPGNRGCRGWEAFFDSPAQDAKWRIRFKIVLNAITLRQILALQAFSRKLRANNPGKFSPTELARPSKRKSAPSSLDGGHGVRRSLCAALSRKSKFAFTADAEDFYNSPHADEMNAIVTNVYRDSMRNGKQLSRSEANADLAPLRALVSIGENMTDPDGRECKPCYIPTSMKVKVFSIRAGRGVAARGPYNPATMRKLNRNRNGGGGFKAHSGGSFKIDGVTVHYQDEALDPSPLLENLPPKIDLRTKK